MKKVFQLPSGDQDPVFFRQYADAFTTYVEGFLRVGTTLELDFRWKDVMFGPFTEPVFRLVLAPGEVEGVSFRRGRTTSRLTLVLAGLDLEKPWPVVRKNRMDLLVATPDFDRLKPLWERFLQDAPDAEPPVVPRCREIHRFTIQRMNGDIFLGYFAVEEEGIRIQYRRTKVQPRGLSYTLEQEPHATVFLPSGRIGRIVLSSGLFRDKVRITTLGFEQELGALGIRNEVTLATSRADRRNGLRQALNGLLHRRVDRELGDLISGGGPSHLDTGSGPHEN